MAACKKCSAELPLNHHGHCAPCRRAYDKAWRLARKAAGKPVVTASVSYEQGQVWRKKYNAQPLVKALLARLQRAYAKRPDERLKNRARRILRTAISNGTMTRQGCIKCGALAHAHHDDYSKPLDVTWFCPKHHAEHHKALRLSEAA